MRPTDRFPELWMCARRALEGESLSRLSSVYYYSKQATPCDPGGAEYVPAGWIRIFREPSRMPQNPFQPAEDATMVEVCWLAHEYGHHLSKTRGTRTPEYEAALGVFNQFRAPPRGVEVRCPTKAEQALILSEESLAWSHGYCVLKDLGVTEWTEFEDERERTLSNYGTTFQNMEKPDWGQVCADNAPASSEDQAASDGTR